MTEPEPEQRPTLVELGVEECLRLVAATPVGRLGFVSEEGDPMILPVNHVLADDVVYVRTKIGAKLLAAERLGQMALRKGDKEKALEHFQVYVKERPSGQAYMQVATVQLDLKKFKEAELSLAEAKKTLRGNLDLAEMYGRLYLETERYGEALESYRAIIKKIPIDNRARFLCGNCLKRLERLDEAKREYRQVLERDPFHSPAPSAASCTRRPPLSGCGRPRTGG